MCTFNTNRHVNEILLVFLWIVLNSWVLISSLPTSEPNCCWSFTECFRASISFTAWTAKCEKKRSYNGHVSSFRNKFKLNNKLNLNTKLISSRYHFSFDSSPIHPSIKVILPHCILALHYLLFHAGNLETIGKMFSIF